MPSERSRRSLLAAGAGLASAASLAGCLGSKPLVLPPGSGRSPPTADGTLDEYDPSRTLETRDIGDPEAMGDDSDVEPHGLNLWNATAESQRVELAIADRENETVVLRETLDLPGDVAVSFRLVEPSAYLVSLRVPKYGVRERLQVPRDAFDCNTSATDVGVFGYEIRSSFYSTLVLCDASGVSVSDEDS